MDQPLKENKRDEEISLRIVDGNKLWTNHICYVQTLWKPLCQSYSMEIMLAHIHHYVIRGAFHVGPTGISPKLLRI